MPRAPHAPLQPGRGPAGAEAGHRREDRPRLGGDRLTEPGPGDQRRQAGCLRGVRDAARPGGRGAPARPILDDLPGVDPAGRGCPGRRRHRSGSRVPGDGGTTGGGTHPADQGSAVQLPVEPDRRRPHPRGDPRDRAVGRAGRDLGHQRRDLRASGLRRDEVRLRPRRGTRARGTLHHRQRGREDLRDDGMAGRVADRAGGRRGRRDQPPVPRDIERLERRPGRRARRGRRPAGRGRQDAYRLRPPPADDAPSAVADARDPLPTARRGVLLLSVGAGRARTHPARPYPHHVRGSVPADP